ncbi:MAG: biotin/lipoyl-binding protein [Lentisphaeraceae bacterium]|nr:biotin/lipoyl-binding protein [Lentisphaeraceae bacterium]
MSDTISSQKLIALRITTALLILLCAEGARKYLASFKKPPAKNTSTEKTYTVNTLEVKRSVHPVFLEGYGVISSSETINISSEISGIISYVNPKVEKGLTVKKGNVLFKIQEKDYELAVQRDSVRIQTLEAQIQELETDINFSKKTAELQIKQLELAENELERQQSLHKKGVGSVTAKDAAEQAVINSESAVLNSKQRIAASTSKIATLKNQIQEAEVAVKINKNNLQKSTVLAPGDLRVKAKYIEEGQLAAPGSALIILENDQKLEIPVMLSGPDVIKWLNLEKGKNNLFQSLLKSSAEIHWVEAKNHEFLGQGVLSRIEDYNSGSRMVKGLVQIEKLNAVAAPGMFCKVKIAGKELTGVYEVPRVALNQKHQLLTVEDGRIKLVKVKPVYDSGDVIYVSSNELSDSVKVINNKLANPVEGLKVQTEAE